MQNNDINDYEVVLSAEHIHFCHQVLLALFLRPIEKESQSQQNIFPCLSAHVDEWNILSNVYPEPVCVPKVGVWSLCLYYCLLHPKLPMETKGWISRSPDFFCIGTPLLCLHYTTQKGSSCDLWPWVMCQLFFLKSGDVVKMKYKEAKPLQPTPKILPP